MNVISGCFEDDKMRAGLVVAAVASWALGIAGLILWYVWSASVHTLTDQTVAAHVQSNADLAFAAGTVGVILGLFLTIVALRGF